MDIFKQSNVNYITSNDINARHIVKMSDTFISQVKHIANKKARAQLKRLLKKECDL